MKKRLIWLSSIIFSLTLIILIGLFSSMSFFDSVHPVNSDVLIIEGWVPPFELEQAIPLIKSDSISRVIIVGQSYSSDSNLLSEIQTHFNDLSASHEQSTGGVWLYGNSSLAFDLRKISFAAKKIGSLIIAIRARGSESAGYFAHFNLIINGRNSGGAFTSTVDSVYTFVVDEPKEGLQSLMVHFGNDLVNQNRDRNLNILSLQVNETKLEANPGSTILIKGSGKYSNGFDSQAGEVKNYLVQLGVPPGKITAISFDPVIRNQTLAAARAFAKGSLSAEILSANILSSGFHSRRTWFTYQKILGNEIHVGVIHYKQSDFKKETREGEILEFLDYVDEAFSYSVNWVYLSFGGG
jgi:hypothetical protein